MQTKLHPIWVSTLFYVTLALAVAPWAAADSTSGTWKMNPEKSKYSPGPAPKSVTTIIESDATHFKVDSHSVEADGTETHISFDAQTDGKDYPLSGLVNADMVSVKHVNDRTTDTTLKKDGKTVMTTHGVVSTDGKTRTVTFDGTDAQGRKVHNVVVYDKQM